MEHYGKKERPYRGMIIPYIVMLCVPVIVYFLCYNVMKGSYMTDEKALVYSSLFFSGLVGIFFGLLCFGRGLNHDFFSKFVDRVKETHELFGLFTKDGFKYYFDCFIRDGGPLFYIFVLVELIYVFICLFGLFNFLDWYNGDHPDPVVIITSVQLLL